MKMLKKFGAGLAVMSAMGLFVDDGLANPEGEKIGRGQATFTRNGNDLIITQGSDRLIVNWRAFSIGKGELTKFLQPGTSSSALNRVLGGTRSLIDGRLEANGQVVLVNPAGITVGRSGAINVNSFIGSTQDITDEDFIAGGDLHFQGTSEEDITNLGTIKAKTGDVYLVAKTITNEGTIEAPEGTVGLGAGTDVMIQPDSEEKLYLRPESRKGGTIVNKGTIKAVAAEIKAAGNPYALAINLEGIVDVKGLADKKASVKISGGQGDIKLAGQVKATNADGSGGKIAINQGESEPGSVDVTGVVDASGTSGDGGQITVGARLLSLTATMDASGAKGGAIEVVAERVLNQGRMLADGRLGTGGKIGIAAGHSYVDTTSALLSATGTGGGGSIRIDTPAAESRIYSSSKMDVSSSAGKGGSLVLTSQELYLTGSRLVADGLQGGGTILAGGDYQGSNAGTVRQAETVYVSTGSLFTANAGLSGDGGKIVVWSKGTTDFYGKVEARGGSTGGNGGKMEVSGLEGLSFGGMADAGAAQGQAGSLLLDPKNLTVAEGGSSGGSPIAFEFVDPNKKAGNNFGANTVVLTAGNVVITAASDDGVASNTGAVYLFNGDNGALISILTGSTANDNVGSGVTALSNGNYVVRSSSWDNGSVVDAGAVTWGSGTSGVSGAVSASNSLVGGGVNDLVGSGAITALSNGNYVAVSSGWDNGSVMNAGAVTWGNGTSGTTGVVSASNSLVGGTANDQVGSNAVTALSNGNYVVRSSSWDNGSVVNVGAVTWGSGTSGTTGAVSASNSLVGSTAGDNVGNSGITLLSNGNYVVVSTGWDNGSATDAGAVTWGSGTSGVRGAVSASNSLVGSRASDQVGLSGVTLLSNGNYVVRSIGWDNGSVVNAGAVTWGSGTSGVRGAVSASNSLVGSTANDNVGGVGVYALSNGNYVVASSAWDNGSVSNAGAVTWGSGTSGVSGAVSASNSLVGSTGADNVGNLGVTLLSNGNYVVASDGWDNGSATEAGAVTWGSGTSGVRGAVSASNSLVGSRTNDRVGGNGLVALSNGNYVVASRSWDNGSVVDAGAVTWGNGTSGTTGAVSTSNSLVGSTAGDNVGGNGLVALSNGNYVVKSASWDNGSVMNTGAVTWGNGTSGTTGVVSASNSLVGGTAGDGVGSNAVTALSNGNYVVASLNWDNGSVVDAGAMTWGSGTSGVSGAVSASNSLVGSTAGDNVGNNGVTVLSNGNYVVRSVSWDNGSVVNAGAVTWGSGTSGVRGVVSASNSLVGSTEGDAVGSSGVTVLGNGNYVVGTDGWDNGSLMDAGAMTWGNGTSGTTGAVSASNSIVGGVAFSGLAAPVVDAVKNTFLARFFNDTSGGSGGKVYAGSTNGFTNLALLYNQNPGGSITIAPSVVTGITNTGTAVILQANNDLTVNSAIITNNLSGTGGTITLQAGRSILLNADITTDGGNLFIYANDYAASGVIPEYRDNGVAEILQAGGTTLNAGGGQVVIELRSGAGRSGAAADSGDIELEDLAAGTILVKNEGPDHGDIVLNGTLSASSAGNALQLVTGGNFLNSAGANALSAPNGRYLVWSTSPLSNTLNGITNYSFKQYAATYGSTAVAQATGNGFLYSVAPVITPTLTGTVTKVYDGNAVATLSPGNLGSTGALGTDQVVLTAAGATYNNPDAGTNKPVTATGLAIASVMDGSVTVYGYQLGSTTVTANIGTITSNDITVSGTVLGLTVGQVSIAVNGVVIGSPVSLDASGNFSFTLSASAANGQAVVWVSNGGTGSSIMALAGVATSGFNLESTWVWDYSGTAATLSGAVANMSTAKGGLASSGVGYSVTSGALTVLDGFNFRLDSAASALTINATPTVTGSIEYLATRAVNANITVSADILRANQSAAADTSVTLRANGNIALGSGVDIKGFEAMDGKLNVTLNSNGDEVGTGNIALLDATIFSNGGDITLGGGSDPATKSARGSLTGNTNATTDGIHLSGSRVSAQGGNIRMNGKGGGANFSGMGVALWSTGTMGSIVETSGAGAIRIEGTGGDSMAPHNIGFVIAGISSLPAASQARVSSVNGAIDIIGYGGSAALDGQGGISVNGGGVIESIGGAITLDGTGGTNVSGVSDGIGLYGGKLTTATGAITIRGRGARGNLPANVRIGIDAGGYLISSGSGDILIESQNGGAPTYGIYLDGVAGSGARVSTTGNVTLSSAGQRVIQSNSGGIITANGLRLIGGAATADFTLTSTANNVATLVADTAGGDVNYQDSNALTIGTVGATSGINAGRVIVRTGGDIALTQSVIALNSGIALVLASEGNFLNSAGANALQAANGRYLVYSTNPTSSVLGGITNYSFKQYNADLSTSVAQASGNGFLYSVAPVITPSLTGTVTKVYDGNATATLAPGNFGSTGAIDGDLVSLTAAGATYNNPDIGTDKPVTATGLTIASAMDGAVTVYGYQLGATTVVANIGTITSPSIAVSGTVLGLTVGQVSIAVNGVVLGSPVSLDANGNFTFSLDPATSGQAVVWVSSGGIGSGIMALNGSTTGFNLESGWVWDYSGSAATLSGAVADMGTAKGGLASSGVGYSVTSGALTVMDGFNFRLDSAASALTINATPTVTGSIEYLATRVADANITVSADILRANQGTAKDTAVALRANGFIKMSPGVGIRGFEAADGKLSVTLNADRDETNAGYIRLSGTTMDANGGNIVLGGGSDPTTKAAVGAASGPSYEVTGIYLEQTTLDAKGGNISLRGQGGGASSTGAAMGVGFFGGSTKGVVISTTGSGSIDIRGTGGASATNRNDGVQMSGSFSSSEANQTRIVTDAGDITIVGEGGTATQNDQRGFAMSFNTLIKSGSGDILIDATGGANAGTSNALYADNSSVTSTSGDITLRGRNGNGSTGEISLGGSTIQARISSGTGEVGIEALGGRTATYSLFLGSGSILASSDSVSLKLLGTATSNAINQSSSSSIIASKLEMINTSNRSIDMSLGSNQVGTLAGNSAGSVSFRNTQALTIGTVNGTVGVTAPSFSLNLGGDLILNAAVNVSSQANLRINGNFINNAGANALSAPFYRVWSTSPELNTMGGITNYNFSQYNVAVGGGALGSGSGFLYTIAPVLTVNLTGSVTKIYNGNTNATLASANFNATGLINGDVVSFGYGSAAYGDANVGTGLTVTANGLIVNAQNGGKTVYGYGLASPSASGAIGSITPKTLTGAIVGNPAKTYDGTDTATLGAANYQLTGFVGGQGATVTKTTGIYNGANVVGTNLVTTSLGTSDFLAAGGTLLTNYILPTVVSGAGRIDAKALTAALIGNPTKVYDGTATATLGSGNYQLSGFVGGQGATVTKTTGVYNDANVLQANTVTASLTSGDFLAAGGTVLTNYVLPMVASGAGRINAKALTAALIGNPAKTYDGTDTATLGSGNYQLTGFVGGQGATVTKTTGTYNSANVLAANTVTASLTFSDFLTTGGANLSNYILPTTASGAGRIDAKALAAALIGNPTKVYDGTNTATLGSGNYQLSGFVGAQGATVTKTTGAYNSANVVDATTVTASLLGSDFLAAGGTILTNYVLPTVVSGAGHIDAKALAIALIGNPTKTYDGTATATLGSGNYQLSGFVGGQGATVTKTSGLYNSANVVEANTVTAALAGSDFLAAGGTILSNYALPTVASGAGRINAKALTGALIGTPAKTYDGDATATLGSGNYQLSGFVGGQGATVTKTSGLYNSANVVEATTVTTSLLGSDFLAAGGTTLSNYVLPTVVSGAGRINAKALTAALIGTPTKVYDATNTATLNSGNYQLTGFVGGQGATVTKTTGTYISANVVDADLVFTSLTSTDFLAATGTMLSNYVLPMSASGAGRIEAKALTVAVVGTPTKTYDGDATAVLSSGNYRVMGFVGGQGATVTETSGLFNSANVLEATTVTASLAGSDFEATLGTRLSNYVLPTTASGAGQIFAKTLTGAIIGNPTKTYDGADTATLNSGNYELNGFVGGQSATVTKTSGFYNSANVLEANTVTSVLRGADFLAAGGTILSNYVLPTVVNGAGHIDAKALVVTIIGTPTKEYDGNARATLAAENYDVAGVVGGESLTIDQMMGLYNSSNVAEANVVMAMLREGNFIAGTDTLLSNYRLPTDAMGAGRLTPKALTVAVKGGERLQGEPNPAFPVTFSGFVPGQGPADLEGSLRLITSASSTSPAGTYAVTPSGLISTNYEIIYVAGQLIVIALPVTDGPNPPNPVEVSPSTKVFLDQVSQPPEANPGSMKFADLGTVTFDAFGKTNVKLDVTGFEEAVATWNLPDPEKGSEDVKDWEKAFSGE